MPVKFFSLALFLFSFVIAGCSQQTYDIVITNGTIIDGTGSAGYLGYVAINGVTIAEMGTGTPPEGTKSIDANGKIVVPGFIDMHTHSDRNVALPEQNASVNYLMQGVTTMVTGNCGGGRFDIDEFYAILDSMGIGTNIVHQIGHGTIRAAAMGYADRAPTAEELEKMKTIIREAMSEGAAGMSTGLFYAPGSFSKTDEVIELAKVVAEYGGFYASHIRDESSYTIGLIGAIAEAIEVGEKSGAPVQISHIKALGKHVWGKSVEICEMIEAAQVRGVDVTADQYPYNASGTSLSAAVVPRRISANGMMRENLRDHSQIEKIKEEITANIEMRGGPESLVISTYKADPSLEGKSIGEITKLWKTETPTATVIRLVLNGSPGIISYNMQESDIEYFMKKPYVMTSSDGHVPVFEEGVPHPRSYGTFPRKLKMYVKKGNVISLERAIEAASGQPAKRLGFTDRGILKEGYFADIAVIDMERIADNATFLAPHQYASGVDHLFVNGGLTISDGKFTGELSGKPLRRK